MSKPLIGKNCNIGSIIIIMKGIEYMAKQHYIKIAVVIMVMGIIGCVGNMPSQPLSSNEAEKDGLLITRYKPAHGIIWLDDEEYFITDAWCSYRFVSGNSKEINTNMYEFYVQMKHRDSDELITSPSSRPVPLGKIDYLGKEDGYANGVGISSGLLSKDFITSNRPTPPDTITFKFNNIRHGDITVNFIRQ